MNSPAVDLKDMLLLSTSTVDLVGFGTDIFVGVLPVTTVTSVVLFNTGGWGNAPNYAYERPTIQAQVRSSSYQAGYALARAIKNDLHGKNGVVINGARYIQILCEGDIHDLGLDPERQYYLFTVNFAVHRTPST